jgi:methylmalonyl-CoA mutase N-terminal domain/subunit
VDQAIDRLRITAEGTENTRAVYYGSGSFYATLGEIIQVMKEVFGVHEEPTMI